MSDVVAVAIVGILPATVTAIANLIVALRHGKKIRQLDETVKNQNILTRAALGTACNHPVDVAIRPPGRDRPKA